MTHRISMIVAAVALGCGLSSNASALPLDYDTPGVVGTVKGQAGDNQNEEAGFAQQLLDLAENTSFIDVSDGNRLYRTHNTDDYSGTIIDNPDEVQYTGSGPITVSGNYLYAIAKYNGQNAGYVLFYLPTFGNQLPQYSYAFWGGEEQYAMSHYTAFNPVPDGGMTLSLLGLTLAGMGLLRRRLS